MIRVRLSTLSAGPDGVRPVGWVGDVPDKEARDLIAGNSATAVKPPASTATKPKSSVATKPQGEKRVKK
jgi:hypothetical protein